MNYFKKFDSWLITERRVIFSTKGIRDGLLKMFPQKYLKHSNANRLFTDNSTIEEFKLDVERYLQKMGIIYQNMMIVPNKSPNPHTKKVISDKYSSIVFKIEDKPFSFTLSDVSKGGPSIQQHETCSIISFEKALKHGNTIVTNFIDELAKIYPGIEGDKKWLSSFQDQTNAIVKYLDGINFKNYSFFRDSIFTTKLYRHAKRLAKFSKKDSWNPADVWIVDNPDVRIKDLLDTQTIEELNFKLKIGLRDKKIIPISLKKTNGTATVEEVNLNPLDDIKNQSIKRIYLDTNFLPHKNSFKNNGSIIYLNNGAKFAVRSVSSKNLYVTVEGAMEGAASQLGKVPVNILNSLLPRVKNSPKDWIDFNIDKSLLEEMYFKISKNSLVDINNSDFEDFISGMKKLYDMSSIRYGEKAIAMSYIYEIINDDNPNDLITKFYYSSQKKGEKFGPFIKIS